MPKLKLCLRRQTQFIDDWFCTSWIQNWRSLKNTTFVQGTMRQWVHFAYVFTGTFPVGSSGSHSPRNTSCDSHTSYSDTEYSTECCEDHILLPRPRALLVCMLAAQWPSISWRTTENWPVRDVSLWHCPGDNWKLTPALRSAGQFKACSMARGHSPERESAQWLCGAEEDSSICEGSQCGCVKEMTKRSEGLGTRPTSG